MTPARPAHAGGLRATACEVVRVLAVLPGIERARQSEPAPALVARLRTQGRGRRARDAAGRARLRRAIGWVDRVVRGPGGANCLRRVLLEIALDAGAAREPVVFGLGADGDLSDGHVWLGEPGPGDRAGRYRVELRL